jgi:hypothetical protein
VRIGVGFVLFSRLLASVPFGTPDDFAFFFSRSPPLDWLNGMPMSSGQPQSRQGTLDEDQRWLQMNELRPLAMIRPFAYDDPETGDHIEVSVSPYYSKITVNSRQYYFISETGEFDGASTSRPAGPILVYDAG